MFNPIDDLFAPGRKHTEDERNRLALTREEEGSNDPARGPIDLSSGTVTVRPPRRPHDAPAAPAAPAAPETPTAPAAAATPAPAQPDPAARVPRPGTGT
jgi:hypothetical protein